jgi:hypothetical protein
MPVHVLFAGTARVQLKLTHVKELKVSSLLGPELCSQDILQPEGSIFAAAAVATAHM